MTLTVCPSCGNWPGNHDPECVVATTIHAIWAATFSRPNSSNPAVWNRAIEAILVDNAARVAAVLNGTPDLPDAQQIEAWCIEHRGWKPIDHLWQEWLDGLDAITALTNGALVASTGTETDDAQP